MCSRELEQAFTAFSGVRGSSSGNLGVSASGTSYVRRCFQCNTESVVQQYVHDIAPPSAGPPTSRDVVLAAISVCLRQGQPPQPTPFWHH